VPIVKIVVFVARRLLGMLAILLVVSFLVFSLLSLAPGDPAIILLGGPSKATPEAIAQVRALYYLDEPLLTQYWYWLQGVVTFDFGRSISSQLPVTDALGERFPVTVALAVYSFIITIAIAIPMGLAAGIRRGSRLDRSVTAVSLVGFAAPVFALAVFLIYVFAVQLGWFPVYGAGKGFVDRVYHLTLPAIALALGQIAIIARQTRAATMDVATQDYITFARVRGVTVQKIWGGYVLRNAALPVITISGLVLAFSLTGAVLVEQAFALPGMGTLLVGAVNVRDVPVVQAITLLTAFVILFFNLIIDVTYFALDPRLRRGAGV
jgi:peptide/nickel transport system permease protein